jgi:hypothetical protein
MATEQELLEREAKVAGQEIAHRFMNKHLKDYDQSRGSAKKIGDYMKANGLEFSEENLERAFQALTAQGVSFVAEPPEEELPPLPEVPGMGLPAINDKFDLDEMSPERYKKLYFGPHAAQFRARVDEILRRAREDK